MSENQILELERFLQDMSSARSSKAKVMLKKLGNGWFKGIEQQLKDAYEKCVLPLRLSGNQLNTINQQFLKITEIAKLASQHLEGPYIFEDTYYSKLISELNELLKQARVLKLEEIERRILEALDDEKTVIIATIAHEYKRILKKKVFLNQSVSEWEQFTLEFLSDLKEILDRTRPVKKETQSVITSPSIEAPGMLCISITEEGQKALSKSLIQFFSKESQDAFTRLLRGEKPGIKPVFNRPASLLARGFHELYKKKHISGQDCRSISEWICANFIFSSPENGHQKSVKFSTIFDCFGKNSLIPVDKRAIYKPISDLPEYKTQ